MIGKQEQQDQVDKETNKQFSGENETSEQSSVEEESGKLVSNFLCILKEGEAPLSNHALCTMAAEYMFCYYPSLAYKKYTVHTFLVLNMLLVYSCMLLV